MPTTTIRDDVRHSLLGFYCDGGRQFWVIFDETPRSAVAAFKTQPDIFGRLDPAYMKRPIIRGREHARISGLMDILLEQQILRQVSEGHVLP